MKQVLPLKLDYIYIGDVLEKLKLIPDKCVRCIVTSPPYYGLRDYSTATWIGGDLNCDHKKATRDTINTSLAKSTLKGGIESQRTGYEQKLTNKSVCNRCGATRVDKQIGLEKTPELYIEKLVAVFRECRRVLTDDGTLWLNIGDTYAGNRSYQVNDNKHKKDVGNSMSMKAADFGVKPKDLIGIPWMLAFALRADGWYLRSDIIWEKENPMPESVKDRPTKAHEYIFLLTKSAKYYYDDIAIRQPLAESVLNDKRLYDKNYTTERPDRNYPGQASHGAGLLKRKSGNLERKDRPGAPEDTGRHQMGSVPWEGMTANKKSVWTVSVKPFKEAHFASFPQDLIVDCIKAGTSQHDQCGNCGKPWIRITKKELRPTNKVSHGTQPDHRDDLADTNDQGSNRTKDGHKPGHYNHYTNMGWKASCSCEGAEVIPDVVLDPFMGAGTTALVSKKLQRNFIGIDLSEKYVKKISIPRLVRQFGRMFYQPQTEFE